MNKYAIRQAITAALYEYMNPQELSAVLVHHAVILAAGKIRLTDEDIQDVRTEWKYLLEKGYLAAVPGYDGYCKLSGDIRSKLDAWNRLTEPNPLAKDERLYGPAALR